MNFVKPTAAAILLIFGSGLLANETQPVESPAAITSLPPDQREGIIFERQLVMTDLSHDSELLGNMVAGVEPADKLPATTKAIADGARDALETFRLAVPGGNTKAEAWTNRADFMRRMEAFAKNSETMAAAGANKDLYGVMGVMVEAMPCKECHDLYRIKKEQ